MLITGLTSSWNKAVSPIITLAMNFHVITRVGDLEHALVFGMDHTSRPADSNYLI